MLQIMGVEIRRGDAVVLSQCTLRVAPGELVWIQGPSGSGKSSLLKAVAGLLPVTGEIALDGVSQASVPAHRWRARVALCPSPAVPLGATVEEDLLVPWRLRVRQDASAPSAAALRAELESVGLDRVELAHPTRELSQGQLARIAFLRTLLAEPQVLLLDEPTANLDPETAASVARRARAFAGSGRALLVAGHTAPWAGTERRFRIADAHLVEGGA